MKSEIVRLKFPVECDICGFRIRPGEKCVVRMNPATGAAYFHHLRCPSGMAIRVRHNPPPRPCLCVPNCVFAN